MDASAGRVEPVQYLDSSTDPVHGQKGVVEPQDAVFPVVHTLYDYDWEN